MTTSIAEIEREQRKDTEKPVEGQRDRCVASYQCVCPGSVKKIINNLEFVSRELICTRCRRRVRVVLREVKRA